MYINYQHRIFGLDVIRTIAILLVLVSYSSLHIFRIDYHNQHNSDSFQTWGHNLRKVVIYRIDSIYYGFIGAYFVFNFATIWQKYKNVFLV